MTEPTPQESPDYGASFADVYDDWYADITDAGATADRVLHLSTAAGAGPVLELGIGSGRIALHLLRRRMRVVGIDASPAMLEQLRSKPGAELIEVHQGDMAEADRLVTGPFSVVLIAFNTFFNLDDVDRQQRCLEAVARLLAPRGSLLVEAFVPGDPPSDVERDLSTARVTFDRVVLTATEHDPRAQTVTGQHIDLTVDGGVRLRPWRIRYANTAQLDEMAAAAGLRLAERWAGWHGEPFDADSRTHVSRYVLG